MQKACLTKFSGTIPFEAGILKAIAYKEGVQIGEGRIKTAGEPYGLRLTPDRTVITGDGMDLSYVLIEAIDKYGNTCPLADHLVEFKLKGEGMIAGVGNGNPQSLDPFQANQVKLFYGKAMLILKSEKKKGNIEVTATSNGLIQDITRINVQ